MEKKGTIVVAGTDVNAFPLLDRDKGGKKPQPKGKEKPNDG